MRFSKIILLRLQKQQKLATVVLRRLVLVLTLYPFEPRRQPRRASCRTRYPLPGLIKDALRTVKQQYVQTIEKRDDFLDVGFLLTDYASDFYDGKQTTLCTYI